MWYIFKMPVTFLSTQLQIRTNLFLFLVSLVAFVIPFTHHPTTCSLVTNGSRTSKTIIIFSLQVTQSHPYSQTHVWSHLKFISSSTRKDLVHNQESRKPNGLGFTYLFSNLNILRFFKKNSTKVRKNNSTSSK